MNKIMHRIYPTKKHLVSKLFSKKFPKVKIGAKISPKSNQKNRKVRSNYKSNKKLSSGNFNDDNKALRGEFAKWALC